MAVVEGLDLNQIESSFDDFLLDPSGGRLPPAGQQISVRQLFDIITEFKDSFEERLDRLQTAQAKTPNAASIDLRDVVELAAFRKVSSSLNSHVSTFDVDPLVSEVERNRLKRELKKCIDTVAEVEKIIVKTGITLSSTGGDQKFHSFAVIPILTTLQDSGSIPHTKILDLYASILRSAESGIPAGSQPVKDAIRKLRESIEELSVGIHDDPDLFKPIKKKLLLVEELQNINIKVEDIADRSPKLTREEIVGTTKTVLPVAQNAEELLRFVEASNIINHFGLVHSDPSNVLNSLSDSKRSVEAQLNAEGVNTNVTEMITENATPAPKVSAFYDYGRYSALSRDVSSVVANIKREFSGHDLSKPLSQDQIDRILAHFDPNILGPRGKTNYLTDEYLAQNVISTYYRLGKSGIGSSLGMDNEFLKQLDCLSNSLLNKSNSKSADPTLERTLNEYARNINANFLRAKTTLRLATYAIGGAAISLFSGIANKVSADGFYSLFSGSGITNAFAVGAGLFVLWGYDKFIVESSTKGLREPFIEPLANIHIKYWKGLSTVTEYNDKAKRDLSFARTEETVLRSLQLMFRSAEIDEIIDRYRQYVGDMDAVVENKVRNMTMEERTKFFEDEKNLEDLKLQAGSNTLKEQMRLMCLNYEVYGSLRGQLEKSLPIITPILRPFNKQIRGIASHLNLGENMVLPVMMELFELRFQQSSMKYPLGEDFARNSYSKVVAACQNIVKAVGQLPEGTITNRSPRAPIDGLVRIRFVDGAVLSSLLTIPFRKQKAP